jgi:hypothetical protein
MNERVKRLTEEIRKLPPEDQADLIDELLILTYRDPDPEIEKAWAEEAQRRLQRFEAGSEPAFEASDVLREIRARLAPRRRT